MMRSAMFVLLSLALCGAGCSKPQPPDKDQPPEPQAAAAAEQNTQLRDAIQQPIDKAKGVEDAVLDAAEQQNADIEAQTGG